MKISHEVPFCLLKKSREFNDYDYCLPHLLDQNEEYKKFFYESKEMGRYIIMDNSLHELGEAYDTDRLMYWINELKPNEFIVPDVWEDYEGSVENALTWSKIDLPEETTKVVVVQAKNENEAWVCFDDYVLMGYEKIAFSYGAAWYNDLCPHPNVDFGKAIGRFTFIRDILQHTPPGIKFHLLGTAWPAEFGMYKNIKQIETIDTSNPVMAGVEYTEYGHLGIPSKPKANMNLFQNKQLTDVQLRAIKWNVEKFRKINEL